MCGRIALHQPTARLARLFEAVPGADVDAFAASYNVAPGTTVPVVITARPRPQRPRPERRLVLLRWGLVPSWAASPSVGNRMINARAESVATRPAFRTALRRRRALVPADGFYEWQAGPGRGPRQPWYFTRADGHPLALAGLWETWRDPQGPPDAPALFTCTIITAAAGPDVRAVHSRTPVVVEPADWERWLDPAVDEPDAVSDLLAAAPAGTLRSVRVGPAVSSVANDGPELVRPVATEDEPADPAIGGPEAAAGPAVAGGTDRSGGLGPRPPSHSRVAR